MNVPERQNRAAVDTAIADPAAEAASSPGAAARDDGPAGEAMDRDDWLCRVGDVARLLREQRRTTEAEGHRPGGERD